MPLFMLRGDFALACALRDAGVIASSALAGLCQGVPWADHLPLPLPGSIWSARLPPGIVGGLAGGVLSAASLASHLSWVSI